MVTARSRPTRKELPSVRTRPPGVATTVPPPPEWPPRSTTVQPLRPRAGSTVMTTGLRTAAAAGAAAGAASGEAAAPPTAGAAGSGPGLAPGWTVAACGVAAWVGSTGPGATAPDAAGTGLDCGAGAVRGPGAGASARARIASTGRPASG